jgi:hypothetical protein
VLGWLPYIDEIVLVKPFFLGTRMKPEFSPIQSPSGHKMQTLKYAMLLLVLEPFIRAGVVHLVPDPGEVNAPFGQHVREVLARRTAGWKPPQGGLHRFLKLGEEDTLRMVCMLPEAAQRRYIAEHMPDADAKMTDRLIAYFKRQSEDDPYTLLQSLPVGEAGAQYKIFKGLNLESALYLAALTGSIIHVDTRAHWEQLLTDAQPAGAPSQSAWEPVRQALGEISFPVELNARRVAERLASSDRPPIRSLLRRLAEAVSAPGSGPTPTDLSKLLRQASDKVKRTENRAGDSTFLSARLELHVPPEGFGRHEVQRLLVMFAGAT